MTFRISHNILTLACACVLAVPCLAATSPWDGNWKVDPSKSKMTGHTFTITEDHGMFTETSGSFKYSFACDGKMYNTIADRKTKCTTDGPGSYTLVHYTGDGKELSTTHEMISPDGKMDHVTVTGKNPDGSPFNDKYVDERIAGSGRTIVGTWKNTKSEDSNPGIMTLAVTGNVLKYISAHEQFVVEAKLDGSPATATGPTMPPGLTFSAKPMGDKMLMTTVMLNGKKLSEGSWTLSADGKTMTDVKWSPDKPDEKTTVVLVKQ